MDSSSVRARARACARAAGCIGAPRSLPFVFFVFLSCFWFWFLFCFGLLLVAWWTEGLHFRQAEENVYVEHRFCVPHVK